jgi:uncharacterized protein (UPF0333 family)
MKKREQLKSEEGVTLLLGLVIMGSLLAITFSIATVLFVEIRNSNDLVLTETAYMANIAIAEEQIFKVKRGISDSVSTFTNKIGGSVNIDAPILSSTSSPIIIKTIPKEIVSFTHTQPTTFLVYNSENPTAGSGYGKISISYLETGATQNLYVYLCEFNPSFGLYSASGTLPPTLPCQSPILSYEYWPYGVVPLSPGTQESWDINPSMQQQIIIFNSNASTKDAYVQIKTFDTDRITTKGLPYAGYKTLNVNAKTGSINRKVEVIIPN